MARIAVSALVALALVAPVSALSALAGGATVASAVAPAEDSAGWIPALDGNGRGSIPLNAPIVGR